MLFRGWESGVFEIEGARLAGGRERVAAFVERELEELEWAERLAHAKEREAFRKRLNENQIARISDPDITAVGDFPRE